MVTSITQVDAGVFSASEEQRPQGEETKAQAEATKETEDTSRLPYNRHTSSPCMGVMARDTAMPSTQRGIPGVSSGSEDPR
jgi:hypothetical protein